MLVENLGQTTLTADSAASTLAMSRRTLTRRLGEEDTSFRAILDDVRAELSRALLQDRSLSIADVAFFLRSLGARGVSSIISTLDGPDAAELPGT